MVQGDQPDWAEIGRRADQLRKDADDGVPVGFCEIAAALESLVRQEVDATSWNEQFLARMLHSPALSRGAADHRRRTKILIQAHRYFISMTPHEEAIVWILNAAGAT